MTTALCDLGEPSLLIDCRRALLLDASPSGRAALGLPSAPGPVALDAAMPAIRTLKSLAANGTGAGTTVLTFWTSRGGRAFACDYRVVSGAAAQGSDGAVLVQLGPADEPGRSLARPLPDLRATNPAMMQVPPERGANREGSAADLVSRLAHELRSPLAAIFTTADVIAEGTLVAPGSARAHDYLLGIRDSARHLLAVLDSMLPARATAPGGDVDLAAIAAEVVRSLGPLAVRAGVTLALETAPGRSAASGEPTAVRRMLFNLGANAIRHAGCGASIVVRVGQADHAAAWLEVEDNGPGIPEDVISRVLASSAVFDDSSRGQLPPGGLGLPLTRELAARNRAVIAIATGPAGGTRVRVTFAAPAAAASGEAATRPAAANEPADLIAAG